MNESYIVIAALIQLLQPKQKDQQFYFSPIELLDYILPEFSIPESRQIMSTRNTLSKVLAFIDLNKQRRFSEGCTIMPIPTTEKRLLSITGNKMQSSRLIDYMIQIGLIEVHDDSYQYNAYYKKRQSQ